MNTKKILKNIQYIVIGSIVAIGLSYIAHAATYSDPSGTLPGASNTPTPLNIGNAAQVKTGGLGVDSFVANANAELDGNTYLGGVVHADSAKTNNIINFGGTDPSGVVRAVALAITGGFQNSGTIGSGQLANTTTSTVCSDANGNVILCGASNVCSNIPGSTTIPSGDVKNADGTCSIAPKKYLSILSENKLTQDIFVGNVFSGTPHDHTTTLAVQPPLVDSIGLDNDTPYGWVVDDIRTVQGTGLDDGHTRLLTVTDPNGSYVFNFNLQGQVGIKGKFASDGNTIGVDFYLKVNNQYIPMDTNSSGVAQEQYPVTGKTHTDFGNTFTSTVGVLGIGGNGDSYHYVPYSVNFNKTLNLKQGDTVDVYALIYGESSRDGLFQSNGSDFNNFYYSMEMNQGSSYSIVETPQ